MKKLISLLIAVLMVFGLLPYCRPRRHHASADSSDGYGDSKSASHPADTLRGFSYFYHDSKFMGGPYGWVSMASRQSGRRKLYIRLYGKRLRCR